MKALHFLICFFLSLNTFAATITSNGTGGGDWANGATWAGGVVPADGDDIIIAAGDVVRIDGTPDVTLNNVTLTIDGTLDMDDSGFAGVANLTLNGSSGIFVSTTGTIVENIPALGEGLSNISVGGVIVWTACSNPICVGIVEGVLDPDPEANGGLTGGSGGLLLPGAGNPLPVEFIFFNATIQNRNVTLKWATATEVNNEFFEIERSFDGVDFEVVGDVDGAGNSEERIDYEFFDPEVPTVFSENIFYRIRQVDFDGKFEYSITVSVNVTMEEPILVRPNPFRNRIIISLNSPDDGLARIVLYDMKGDEVIRKDVTVYRGLNDIEISEASWLSSGTYILKVQTPTFSHNERLIKGY